MAIDECAIYMNLFVKDRIEWCYPDGTVNNGNVMLQCPPIRYACARSDFDMLSPRRDPIPPPCKIEQLLNCIRADYKVFDNSV